MALLPELQACRTPAEIYAAIVRLQQEATPADVRGLMPAGERLPERLRTWLITTDRIMTREVSAIAPHVRRPIAPWIDLYADPAQSPGRVLVVGFCALSNLLTSPLPSVLQAIAHGGADLLLLRERAHSGFLLGIDGYAGDLAALAERLNSEPLVAAYADRRTLGTSSGGAPSVLAARLLGARRALCIGGRVPFADPKLSASREALIRERWDAALRAALAQPAVRTGYLHAAGNAVDRRHASDLKAMVPGQRLELEDSDEHALVHHFAVHGQLAAILRMHLLD